MKTIDPNRVDQILKDCLFKDNEDSSNHIRVEGITVNMGLHPERLNSYKDEIINMLNLLPDSFKLGGGGGMSFLNMCNTNDGNLWTGEHRIMESLVLLGIGINRVKFLMPKFYWDVLPGGMPYLCINDEKDFDSSVEAAV